MTRVFSGPPVAFHISSIESIISSSSFAAPTSSDCLTFAGLLVGLPERLVDAGVLLEVLGLEVVAPEDVEVVLDELGALLLDVDASRLEQRVVAGLVLLDDPQAGLRLDARLLGVVDAAGDVAVGVDDCGGGAGWCAGTASVSFRSGGGDRRWLGSFACILGRVQASRTEAGLTRRTPWSPSARRIRVAAPAARSHGADEGASREGRAAARAGRRARRRTVDARVREGRWRRRPRLRIRPGSWRSASSGLAGPNGANGSRPERGRRPAGRRAPAESLTSMRGLEVEGDAGDGEGRSSDDAPRSRRTC